MRGKIYSLAETKALVRELEKATLLLLKKNIYLSSVHEELELKKIDAPG